MNTVEPRKILVEVTSGTIMTGSKYKQFKQTKSKGFIAVQCPNCNETFGLNAQYVEKIGEVSYLVPFTCPYCSGSYTLKND
jgi:predicted nucleic-acid-binding Zn-ribbon protein